MIKSIFLFALPTVLLALGNPVNSSTLRVTDFGAQCNGTSDDTAEIQAAFNSAQVGDFVEFPPGTCVYSNTLNLSSKTNVQVYGAGMNNTVLKSVNVAKSAFRVINGQGIYIQDLQLQAPGATTRSADPSTSGFYVQGGNDVNFSRVKVDRVASVGIFVNGGMYVRIFDSEVRNTLADGIHVTGGSYSVTVSRNTVVSTGDDSFSCVGYGTTINHYVGFFDNSSTSSGASGVTVEGCEFVEVHRNTIASSRASGVRIASWIVWPTGRVNEVEVRWNVISNSPTGDTQNHHPILVATDNQLVEQVHIRDNTINWPRSWTVARLYGINGGLVRNSQVERNTVWSGYSVTDCVVLQGATSNIWVNGNVIDGRVCN